MKLTEGYPLRKFECRIHDEEETPLHTVVKHEVAYKLNFMTPQELCGSETWEDANKKFPIRGDQDGQFTKNLIYNHIPRQDYNQKRVFIERQLMLETPSGPSFPIQPDICILDSNFKPQSIFEIIVTSKPKSDKLIALIEAPINVIFIYAEDVIKGLSRKFNIHRNWAHLLKCFTGWSATDSLKTKVSRAVDMLIADKFPASDHEILGKKIKKNKDVYNLHVKTTEGGWTPHLGSKKGKPASTINSLIKYYAEKTDSTSEEMAYDNNSMTVKFVVERTLPAVKWSPYPFHIGMILEASQGETSLFKNRKAAIINQTSCRNIEDGKEVHFICGTYNSAKKDGYYNYYANRIANEKKNFNQVWMLE